MCKWTDNVQPCLQEIEYWRSIGLTVEQICKNLNVGKATLHRYATEHPELSEALKQSKEKFVSTVVVGMNKRALGFSYNEKKITKERILDADGKDTGYEKVKTEITEKMEHPSVDACKFILKNLAGETWKDKQEIDTGGISVVIIEPSYE